MNEPESMDELIFFTNRNIGNGKVKAWAYRPVCPHCKKGMGKPVNNKNKIALRAESYVCKSCSYSAPKTEAESTVVLHVQYVCPNCGGSAESTTPYKRTTWQGVQSYVFTCAFCKESIGITKKMKEPKKKAMPLPDHDL